MDDRPLDERLDEDGEVVFSQYWDSGGPGAGADSELAIRLDGQYWLWLSYEWPPKGPYATLAEAIEEGELFSVGSATQEVYSTELTAQEIASSLQVTEPLGHPILINEQEWELDDDGKFVRSLGSSADEA